MNRRVAQRPVQSTHGIKLSPDGNVISVVKLNLIPHFPDEEVSPGVWRWMKRRDGVNREHLNFLIKNTNTFECMNFKGIDKRSSTADIEARNACPGTYRFVGETRWYYVIQKSN